MQRKPSMPPICPPSITPRAPGEQHKSTSAALRLAIWWATLRKWTVQHKSSTPPICPLSITVRGRSERHKSTSAANRSTFYWAYPLTPRAPTGRPKSTSAVNPLEPWCSPGRQTEKHKSSTPLLRWSRLGHTRTLGGATAWHKSTSAAKLLRPWCSPGRQTEKHKSSTPLLRWSRLGHTRTLGGATPRHKSTSAAKLLRPQRPQEAMTVTCKSTSAADPSGSSEATTDTEGSDGAA